MNFWLRCKPSYLFRSTERRKPSPPPATETAPDPEWYTRALALEREDRLDEAEKTISDGVPHLYFAFHTAEMYRGRLIRLRSAGDSEGAELARAKATQWAYYFASQATSGGEGTALSRERDEFLSTLDE